LVIDRLPLEMGWGGPLLQGLRGLVRTRTLRLADEFLSARSFKHQQPELDVESNESGNTGIFEPVISIGFPNFCLIRMYYIRILRKERHRL